MLHLGRRVADFNVGNGVGPALVPDEKGVALGEVLGPVGGWVDLHQSPVGVLAVSGRDALGDDGALGVLADVDHLGAGVGLLVVVDQGHRVELAHRVVPLEDHAGVLPGDSRAGLNLGPGNLGVLAGALAPLGDEVVDPTLAFLVARVPVLQGGVLDFGVVQRDQLDHRGVELAGLPHGSGTAFQVADVAAFLGDDEGPLELAGLLGVDSEVGHQLNGAAGTLRNVGEGPVAEHGGVQCCVEVVGVGDHRTQVLLHQFGVVLDGFAHGAEDDAGFLQHILVGGGDGDTVQHGVNRHAGHPFLLVQGDAELVESLHQLRVHLVQALGAVPLLDRGGVVVDVLKVDGVVVNVGPGRLFLVQPEPMPEGPKPPLQHPLGLVLLGGNEPDDVLVQALGGGILLDVDGEAPLVVGLELLGRSRA